MRTITFVLIFSLVSATAAIAGDVRVSAAASMTDAVRNLVAVYESHVKGVHVLPNFASSGALAKQIARGAPTDIFLSANPEWMRYLVDQKRVPGERVRTVAYNTLVFVGNRGLAVSSLEDVANLSHIAVGSPRSVPAGQYARQALTAAGLYDRVREKLVMAKDVRQALVYADRGETDGAFVYRSDALLAKHAVILLSVPRNLYDEVTYPAGLTVEGCANPEAVAFFGFLGSPEARDVLKRHGFVVK